ncbi:asparagine synthase (glutamine-hydrolyzing) [Tengunoibacter tsumagoiensis]|uniref:asparagine synthase (glutamine-hydrolyzing) n=1 Tax=Tengunoibacter tsumagoiensis TaxID=2014871 RepID=A0A402A744_9CHLR|nr:asparagine synthase (glutamine-hydrolyzing) [Tengunoibacter tsumagoiensis]GCE14954.1 asparagine synthetase B [Tengunoibacter tsumagoiensis]
MCGICGIIGNPTEQDTSLVLRMMEHQSHRGPDDASMFAWEQGCIGFRRLTIVGGEEGKQPIMSENQRIVVFCNGEIYNYKQLRSFLLHKQHQFLTSSDVEVIVHLYEEYGCHAWEHLKGDFAFVLIDRDAKRTFLVRDRVGVKPLYVANVHQRWYFSSEIQPLLQAAPELRCINEDALRSFFQYRFVPHPLTPFKHIYKVSPGSELCFTQEGVQHRQYWHIPGSSQGYSGTFDEACVQLDEIVRSSVAAQGVNEVPTGILLSGGIDSNVLLSHMAEKSRPPFYAYTVDFEQAFDHQGVSEFSLAHEMCETVGATHVRVPITPQEYAEALPATIACTEEFTADPANTLLYLVLQRAHRDVRVLLAGDGVDELFAGYPAYRRFLNNPHQQLYGRRILSPDYEASLLKTEYRFASVGAWQQASLPSWVKAQGIFQTDPHELTQLQTDDQRLQKMLENDIRFWLCDNLLLRMDKITMRWSVEGRVPFLDHDLINFALTLPNNWKLHPQYEKYIMRYYARRYLPTHLVERKKTGFTLPLDAWLQGPLRSTARDLLLDAQFLSRYIHRSKLEACIKSYFSGEPGIPAHMIISLMCLEYWHRLFLAV